jgi:outer membrane protein assembly factor BamB
MDRSKWFSRFRSTFLFFALGLLSGSASAIWQNDWNMSAPPLLAPSFSYYGPTSSSGFSSDGSVVFAGVSISPFNTQITRLDGAGSLLWVANVDYYNYRDYLDASSLVANDDGSAFVALGDGSGQEVARIDPSGGLAWMRELPAQWMAKLPGNRLATRDCKKLTVLDASTGDVIWERAIAQKYYCDYGGLLVDAASNIYLAYNAADTLHRLKLNSAGGVVYDVASGSIPYSQKGLLVAIDNANFYVYRGGDLLAFRQSDGAQAWSTSSHLPHWFAATQDATPELVILDSSSVRRLAADSGSERWSYALSNGKFFEPIADSIVVNDGSSLLRLNATTGALVWSTSLPTVDDSGNPLYWKDFGGLANNRIIGMGRSNLAYKESPPFVQPIEFSSGNLLARSALPLVAQGVEGVSTVANPSQIVSVAYSWSESGITPRIRSVDSVTGMTQWETVDNIPLEELSFTPVLYYDFSVGEEAIAVVFTLTRAAGQGPNENAFQVALYDRTTGAKLWSVPIFEPLQTGAYSIGPKLDAAGSVYVEIAGTLPCGTSTCDHTRLYKLSRQTGAVVWIDDQPGYRFRHFELFGNDVVRAGSYSGSNKTLVRLSGEDGSEQWSSTLFSADGDYFDFYRIDPQHIIFSSSSSNAKIDIATGNPAWTVANTPINCPTYCEEIDSLVFPNGDALSAGVANSAPLVVYEHNDGSGSVDQWDLAPNSSELHSSADGALLTPSGIVKLTIRRQLPGTGLSIRFMGQFDPATGILSDQQLIGPRPLESGSSVRYWRMLSWLNDTDLLAAGVAVEAPFPATTSVAKLDASILARGDLTASLVVSSDVASPGQWVDFHLAATYSGDQPIESVHLLGSMPWKGGVRALSCSTVSASDCVIDTRFGSVESSFDILPGGSVTIDGQVQMLDGYETNYLGVGIYGPTSLGESNTINNFARSKVIQSLFSSGFD